MNRSSEMSHFVATAMSKGVKHTEHFDPNDYLVKLVLFTHVFV